MAGILRSAAALLTVLIICSTNQIADGVEGRLFMLAFPDPSPGVSASGFQQFFISGDTDGKVRIEYKTLNKTEIVSLNSTNKRQYTVTMYQDLSGPAGNALPAAVIVSAEMDISVQAHKEEDGTGGGYLALPITSLSTEFYMASYTPRTPKQSTITIAAPYDTCVDVRYYNGQENYRMAYLTLPPGSVYHLVSSTTDYTGVNIVASKPVAVYGGLDCAYIDLNAPVESCDYIVEQLPPKSQYGTRFIMSSPYGRNPSAGYVYRVVATLGTNVATTTITYDSTNKPNAPVINPPPPLVRKGKFAEGVVGRGINGPAVLLLTCSPSCLVEQYHTSGDAPKTPAGEPANVKPDSSMTTVLDLDHYTKSVTFSTSKYFVSSGNTSAEFVNGITVVCKKADVGSIMLDGSTPISSMTGAKSLEVPITTATGVPQFSPDTYMVVYGAITPGFHTVTSNKADVKFMVHVYGHAQSTSTNNVGYGYLAGFNYLTEIDKPVTSGPYFDFTDPKPVVTPPGPIDDTPVPSAPLTDADYPKFDSIWDATFYTLVPTNADLKTRECSEAYYKYYLEKRFIPMKDTIGKKFFTDPSAPFKCAPGIRFNMTNEEYYSEFTHGQIRIHMKVYPTSDSTATLNDLYTCWGYISDYITPYTNWWSGYKDVTDFLKRDADYTRDCDTLHMKTPNFASAYFGWQCPMKGGKLGASGANAVVAAPLATLVALLLVQLVFVRYLR